CPAGGPDRRGPGPVPPPLWTRGGDPGPHPVTPKAARQLGPSNISSLIRGTLPKMADATCVNIGKTHIPYAAPCTKMATHRATTSNEDAALHADIRSATEHLSAHKPLQHIGEA
ncbi:Hypothetical predicted protein, partial [Pelobates cultripes]